MEACCEFWQTFTLVSIVINFLKINQSWILIYEKWKNVRCIIYKLEHLINTFFKNQKIYITNISNTIQFSNMNKYPNLQGLLLQYKQHFHNSITTTMLTTMFFMFTTLLKMMELVKLLFQKTFLMLTIDISWSRIHQDYFVQQVFKWCQGEMGVSTKLDHNFSHNFYWNMPKRLALKKYLD
jgi:hypothetical protein